MSVHPRPDVLTTIRQDGVVPVFTHPDTEVGRSLARSVVAGGLRTLEFTNRGDGALDALGALIPWARSELPDLIVGVGSIVDGTTATEAIGLGVSFIFGPSLDADVAAACEAADVPYVPGCGTVTEIVTAHRLGSDFVKLFPAGALGGPGFLSAVRGPCPWVEAIPTGGVEPTVESLGAWFAAGAPAVGMGSKLIPAEMVAAGDWKRLTTRIADTVANVRTARRV